MLKLEVEKVSGDKMHFTGTPVWGGRKGTVMIAGKEEITWRGVSEIQNLNNSKVRGLERSMGTADRGRDRKEKRAERRGPALSEQTLASQ